MALAIAASCAFAGAARAQEPDLPPDMSDGDAVLVEAYRERARACASERARGLFARAAELGERRATYHLGETYDPLRCDAPATDARRAAELYRGRAEAGLEEWDTTLQEAVKAWARLVEKGLASPAPFEGASTLLHHYGSVLLQDEHHAPGGVELLRLAFLGGSEDAYGTLRRSVDGSAPGAASGRAAAHALGTALGERFPGGERDDEAIDLLMRSGRAWAVIPLLEERLTGGRLDEDAKVWLLDQLPARSRSLRGEEHEVTARLLSDLLAAGASPPARRAAAAYLYRAVADELDEVSTAAEWRAVEARLDRALDADPSEGREVRHADALYAAVANARAGDDLERARTAALRRVAAAYGAHAHALHTAQLARLAMLSWHGLGSSRSADSTRALFEALARRGDAAARNTLRLAKVRPALFDPVEASFVAALDEFLTGRIMSGLPGGKQGGGVCGERDLGGAIGSHAELYGRLMAMRGYQHEGHEIARMLADGISLSRLVRPGSGTALFGRDDLSTCVWLLLHGSISFEAVYVPAGFVRDRLDEFFRAEGIYSSARERSPIPRLGRGLAAGVGPSPGKGGGDPLRAISLALFPGVVGEGLANLTALTVVPIGNLGVVPFAALPLHDGGAVLLDRMAVTVAPNFVDLFAGSALGQGFGRIAPGCGAASTPWSLDRGTGHWAGPALVVGDPDLDDPEFVFPRLPGARAEAMEVAELLGANALVGAAATLQAVVEAVPHSPVLYFATHGVAAEKSGLDGFVALAGGRLSARQVQGMCLRRARLAVLSACQTGLGQSVGGGVIGLARAFQIAGIPDVVMSLWNVDDTATRALMTGFVREIRSGVPAAEALRAAMISARAAHPEPKHWASFTVFSETFAGR